MRKVLLIVGSLAVVLVTAVTLAAYFLLGKAEKEKNIERTRPARDAKAKKLAEVVVENVEPKTESDERQV